MGIGDLVRVKPSTIFGHYSGQTGVITNRPAVDMFTVRVWDRANGLLMINAREQLTAFYENDLEVITDGQA